MNHNIPRNEYPRPALVRDAWTNLNGEWGFEFDEAKCGFDLKFFERESLDRKIVVPFCPESKLSGIGDIGFHNCVWYRKNIEIPASEKGKRVILHFGAVDYETTVYVNGKKVGTHIGGYSSFNFDITDFLAEENNYVTVAAVDNTRSGKQPLGKQCEEYNSAWCFYTRTTGIWQTVWLEYADEARLINYNTVSDIENVSVTVNAKFTKQAIGAKLCAKVYYEGKPVGEACTVIYSEAQSLYVKLSEKHLWEVGHGRLYDVVFTIEKDGKETDRAEGYFGLRTVGLDSKRFLLNGKSVFGRWVLDQGYYPDGIYTAPSDEALKADIIYGMELGFNGARLHQKVFEERFLYHADKLGYLCWGEFPTWGLHIFNYEGLAGVLPEWLEVMERDMNHPSIIGWCPFNETWNQTSEARRQDNRVVEHIYRVTKAVDPTRPCIDTSGNFHVVTDIFDVHDYEQNVETFKSHYETLNGNIGFRRESDCNRQFYKGEPFFNSEYGGIKWTGKPDENSWGYGNAPKTEQEFLDRYKGLTDVLLDDDRMLGFCYTQLYDVEQEKNGLMTYEREYKFDPKIIHAINSRKAAIEE